LLKPSKSEPPTSALTATTANKKKTRKTNDTLAKNLDSGELVSNTVTILGRWKGYCQLLK
jgi:hypothetical protein